MSTPTTTTGIDELDASGPARQRLLVGRTPLQPAPRLSEELGVAVYLKRDDLTGLGLGGNKVRGLEYLIADALQRGCDCLVTGAGPQSNWTVLAALAAMRSGLRPHVVCYGEAPEASGNLLLHRRLAVDIRFTGEPERSSVDAGIVSVAGELRAAGHLPYVVPRGGAAPLGALGYLRASIELATQFAELPAPPGALWLATGSGGTQAGLVAGAAALGASYEVVGVTVSRPAGDCRQRVSELATAAGELIGRVDLPVRVMVREGWIGPGYGVASPAGAEAARLVASTEGVFLDPVFGAKAMAALIAECRRGEAPDSVVFLVGGGAGTLFAAPRPAVGGAM